MDLIESKENEDFNNGMPFEQSLPLGDPMDCDSFREQEIFPRIGEEYQVAIPELVEKSDYLSHEKNSAETKSTTLDYLMGLPIPLMPINQVSQHLNEIRAEDCDSSRLVTNGRGVAVGESLQKAQISLETNNQEVRVMLSEGTLENGIESGESTEVTFGRKLHEPGSSLVPGSASDSWNDLEKASFLLGLYIFQKNFIWLRRFVESKQMEDIQSFYYGKFYRSPEHCRWSEGRKIRSRRCVYGQKIFTGLRLQELLSRIIPLVAEECKNTLLEVTKMFGEGKMPFEEFVFSLRTMVGMNILVEAVRIGKGKQDLTGMALEPSKSNQTIPMRQETPIGKACSSLTSSEIVKYLTGDYRLSKARSNDLFWEAVWPRLLARGWQSEEAKDQIHAAGSKNALVFLVPGVKRFSRRRLTKGDHYFDSVSDVLSKVASEPGLIELDSEEDESKRHKEEYEWNDETNLEEDDVPTQRRHCYLKPRTPNRSTDGMKFTVVDTSLGDGKPYKVRELRSLSFDISNQFNSRSCIDVSDDDTPEVSTDESDAVDRVSPHKVEYNNAEASYNQSNDEVLSDGKNLKIGCPKQEMCIASPDSESVPVDDFMNRKHLFEDKKPEKLVQYPLSCSLKEDNLDNTAPHIEKRRRLTACNHPETSDVITTTLVGPKLESEMPTCSSASHDFVESVPSQLVAPQDKLSVASSSKGSPSESVEYPAASNFVDPEEAPQSQTLIDLNILPQVPPDFENGISMTDITGEDDDSNKDPGYDASQTSQDVACSEQLLNLNPQRRSTRNRPPTTRALEALANGFLTVQSRRKGRQSISRESSSSRPSRRARGGPELSEFQPDSVTPLIQGDQNGAGIDTDKNVASEFQVLLKENGPPISGP